MNKAFVNYKIPACVKFTLICLITSITSLIALHYSLTRHSSADAQISKNSKVLTQSLSYQHIQEPKSVLYVLLQQSQVHEGNQFIRLNNIDKSWAKWTKKNNCDKYDQQIVASIPFSTSYAHISSTWKHIKSMRMFPLTRTGGPDDAIRSSPYHNFIKSLFGIFSNSGGGDAKWIMVANDHTFIIPGNLDALLQTLDHETLVYTGTELRTYPLHLGEQALSCLIRL